MLLRKTDLFSRPAQSEWFGETVFKAEMNKALQLAEQVGCLTNRFIGNKQQYFLRRALQVTVPRGAKRNHSSAESFLAANLYKCFGIFVIAMRYVRFVYACIFRPRNRHGNAAV